MWKLHSHTTHAASMNDKMHLRQLSYIPESQRYGIARAVLKHCFVVICLKFESCRDHNLNNEIFHATAQICLMHFHLIFECMLSHDMSFATPSVHCAHFTLAKKRM